MPQLRNFLFLPVLVSCLVLCSCAAPTVDSEATHATLRPAATCHGEPFLRTELFFGFSIRNADGSDSEVTEQQWREFVDGYVTPRFPDGLTILDSQGQWRQHGRVVKEKGKLLILLHPLPNPGEADAADRNIEVIRDSYKRLFHQDSVLRTTAPAGVSF